MELSKESQILIESNINEILNKRIVKYRKERLKRMFLYLKDLFL